MSENREKSRMNIKHSLMRKIVLCFSTFGVFATVSIFCARAQESIPPDECENTCRSVPQNNGKCRQCVCINGLPGNVCEQTIDANVDCFRL